MRAGTSSEHIRAKTDTRLPGAAAHSRRSFSGSWVLAISPFSTPAGAHGGAAAPPEREVEWAAAS